MVSIASGCFCLCVHLLVKLLIPFSLFPSSLLDPPRINITYIAQTAADLGVNQVFVVGHTAMTTFTVGQSVAFVCPFTGILQPTAQWFFNAIDVDDSGPRINITQSTDRDNPSIYVSTLTIANLMASDLGSYQCRVSNNIIGREVSEGVVLGQVG